MRRSSAALLLLAAVARADAPVDPLQDLAGAYRAGRPADVLDRAADVLEADPGNREVRHYLWTVGRQLKEDAKGGTLKRGERLADLRLAERSLERRRRETEETLGRLRSSYERSRRVTSPADVLAGAEGMGRLLDERFDEERQRALADGYFRGLVENLTTALKKKAFVTRKDQLVAQAWLSYYGGDRKGALRTWEAAAREDPADKDVANNLDQLRRTLRREEDEKLVRAWGAQAATYQETGFDAEALELWEKILEKFPGRADVQRRADECRAGLKAKEKSARLAAMTEEGVRLYKDGKTLDAAQVWFRVLEQDPSYRQARVWLTHAGRQLGAMEPAPVMPEPARPARSGTAVTDDDRAAAMDLHKQGLIAYAQDHVAQAVELWERALARDPGLAQAQQALRQAKAEMSFKKTAGR